MRMLEPRTVLRYSLAFKQKVVSEIESGKLTVSRAGKVYDITGHGTINTWLRQLGKSHLLNRVVRIQMKGEQDKMQLLKKRVQELESALASAHLKNLYLETLIDVASKETGIDIKKNIDTKPSRKPSAKGR